MTGVRGAVGATKSVEEMMAGDGIGIGCGEGLKRNKGGNKDHKKDDAAGDEPGETGSLGHLLTCFIRLITVVATLKIRIVFPDGHIRSKQGFFPFPWTLGHLRRDLPSNRCY